MFTGAINLVPGQELRQFDVYRSGEHRTDSGRIIANGGDRIGSIRAVLAAAKPEETQRWRQLEHPVSHNIIYKQETPYEIRPGDSLVQGNMRYIVQAAPYNVGGIGHWTIYYCNERSDV